MTLALRTPFLTSCTGVSRHSQLQINEDPSVKGKYRPYSLCRRTLGAQLLTLLGSAPLFGSVGVGPANAALVQFPANRLNNNYILVRAGESVAESRGYVLSNPVSKTSMDSGLSQLGKEQVVRQTLPTLEQLGACEGGMWLWPSIPQNAYQTAEILAALCGVGRSRIVPEYSFLDARGVGMFERGLQGEVAADMAKGDARSPDWRPPPGVDGTPHESASDVMVRVRQLLSVTETQYLGDTVLIIAPDSANLSILQTAVLGQDLRTHGTHGFVPGEARPLLLSTLQRDDSPQTIPCPNPPQCR